MAFLTGAIFSESLNMDTTVSVILPHDSRFHRGICEFPPGVAARENPKTLILLHGLTDNWVAWGHRSRILCYAEMYDVAVIMPEVQRSFYQDMEYGEAYFTYVTEELPELAARMFNVSVSPEDLMLAGLSMGGYGALRCGLSNPGNYRAIGAFSSATDIEGFVHNMPVRRETLRFDRVLKGIFGENLRVPEGAILTKLADKAASSGANVPIMMTCGTEDELYAGNVDTYEYLKGKGMNVTFDEWPGIHEWGFWDKSILLFLERFAGA
ncbi:MAG: alpha/beta hydrolase-fold protein [Clostridia bacterium]|nr:alpha/beta hydrolase-fold protein [Clostridia bacterium]